MGKTSEIKFENELREGVNALMEKLSGVNLPEEVSTEYLITKLEPAITEVIEKYDSYAVAKEKIDDLDAFYPELLGFLKTVFPKGMQINAGYTSLPTRLMSLDEFINDQLIHFVRANYTINYIGGEKGVNHALLEKYHHAIQTKNPYVGYLGFLRTAFNTKGKNEKYSWDKFSYDRSNQRKLVKPTYEEFEYEIIKHLILGDKKEVSYDILEQKRALVK